LHLIPVIQYTRINKCCFSLRKTTVLLVYMTKNMVLGLHLIDSQKQFLTSSPFSIHCFVQSAKTWAMCNQHICIIWNQIPMLFYLFSTISIKSPVIEPRGDGRTPQFKTFDFTTGIIQVNHAFGNHLLDNPWVRLLEKEIVVAGNEYFVFIFLLAEPIQKIFNLIALPPLSYIARMDEQIACWQFQ